jgi:hypothetical protein
MEVTGNGDGKYGDAGAGLSWCAGFFDGDCRAVIRKETSDIAFGTYTELYSAAHA